MPYTIDQFAAQIKSKQPQYKDWDNKYLVAEVLNKVPAYQSWVSKEDFVASHKIARQTQMGQLNKNFQAVPEATANDYLPNNFLGQRATNLNSAMQRQETGQQGGFATGVQAFTNLALGPALDIAGIALTPIDKLRQGVLNQGAGRLANVVTGQGNKPTAEPDILSLAQSEKGKANLQSGLDLVFAGMMLSGAGNPKAKSAFEETRTSLIKLNEQRIASQAEKNVTKVNDLAGKIAQSKIGEQPSVSKALSEIDISKINTYKDLAESIKAKTKEIADLKGQTLATDTKSYSLKDLTLKTKVGEKMVGKNYVSDALTQLEEYYTKINDAIKAEKIAQLRAKAENIGLTVKELDDLAVQHGIDLNGYNANGELASGLTKQAAENTRMGVKVTAREKFNNPAYKAADAELSNLLNTQKLIDTMAEKVNAFGQKVQQRSWGAKAGRLAFKVADLFTLGALKGFTEAAFPRGLGLKMLNVLDLEKMLRNNLKKMQKLTEGNMSESAAIKAMEEVLKGQEPKVPTKLGEIPKGRELATPKTALGSLKTAPETAITPNGKWQPLTGKVRNIPPDVKNAQNVAIKNEPTLVKQLQDLTGGKVSSGIKGLRGEGGVDSLLNKVANHKGNLSEVYDILGTRVTAPEAKLPGILEKVKQNFKVIEEQGVDQYTKRGEWPYEGVNLKVKLADGSNAEIQLHTPESLAITNNMHGFYKKWQNIKEADMTPEQTIQFNADRKNAFTFAGEQKIKIEKAELKKVISDMQKNKGGTYDLMANKPVTEGYAVSLYPERSQVMSGLTADKGIGFIEANKDLFGQKGNNLGAWYNTDTGKFVFDITHVVKDLKQATELGKKYNQISIYDLVKGKEIPTGGTGENTGQYGDIYKRIY